MTLQKHFENQLVNHGLWPEEAVAVLEKAVASPQLAAMNGRWSEETSAYPTGLIATVWLSVKTIAKQHLTETAPRHFALALL